MTEILVADADLLRSIVREEIQRALVGTVRGDETMSTADLAKYLGRSIYSARRLCRLGKLKSLRDGRDYLVMRSEAERYARG